MCVCRVSGVGQESEGHTQREQKWEREGECGYKTVLLSENRNDEERERHTTRRSMQSVCTPNLFKNRVVCPVIRTSLSELERNLFSWSPQQGEIPKCVERG